MTIIKDATIVDVRTREEFTESHFPGAINIPLDQVPRKVQDFKNMRKPIIAYCVSGNRSGIAISLLKQSGIEDVQNGGGLQDMLQQYK